MNLDINIDVGRDLFMITDTLVESEFVRSANEYLDSIDAATYALLARRDKDE